MKPRLIYKNSEHHYVHRTGWLRAAVLGANDGIISVSSIMVGVAMASSDKASWVISGIAGLVAGAMSMAAGEYVSVSSQGDLEKADLEREKKELLDTPEFELQELTGIYIKRGVEPGLAREVARQMMAKDAIGVHAREELGISDLTTARPFQAAVASACAFSCGAALPVFSVFIIPSELYAPVSSALSIILLGFLGGVAAKIAGAPLWKSSFRVMFWGAFAMGLTAFIGRLAGNSF